MQIYIQTVSGEVLNLEVNEEDTVEMLKGRLAEVLDAHVVYQRLLLEETLLEDKRLGVITP